MKNCLRTTSGTPYPINDVNMYLQRNFRFLLVGQSHDGQHQVDQVERAEEYDDRKKDNAHGSGRGQNLKAR